MISGGVKSDTAVAVVVVVVVPFLGLLTYSLGASPAIVTAHWDSGIEKTHCFIFSISSFFVFPFFTFTW